jgi:hypothetical protein
MLFGWTFRRLSRMFRGKLLAFLRQSYRRNQLCFPGTLAELSTPRALHSLSGALHRRDWEVYSKPQFRRTDSLRGARFRTSVS